MDQLFLLFLFAIRDKRSFKSSVRRLRYFSIRLPVELNQRRFRCLGSLDLHFDLCYLSNFFLNLLTLNNFDFFFLNFTLLSPKPKLTPFINFYINPRTVYFYWLLPYISLLFLCLLLFSPCFHIHKLSTSCFRLLIFLYRLCLDHCIEVVICIVFVKVYLVGSADERIRIKLIVGVLGAWDGECVCLSFGFGFGFGLLFWLLGFLRLGGDFTCVLAPIHLINYK